MKRAIIFMRLFFNWLEWCIRMRTICPWSVRLVGQKRHVHLTPTDIEWAKRVIAEYEGRHDTGRGFERNQPDTTH